MEESSIETEKGAPGPLTVLLADDHAVIRSGLRMLLDAEADIEVVAEAGDLPETMRRLKAHKPSVLVLDLNMPGKPSIPAIPDIREAMPDTQIVVLTMNTKPGFHERRWVLVPRATSSAPARARSPEKPANAEAAHPILTRGTAAAARDLSGSRCGRTPKRRRRR